MPSMSLAERRLRLGTGLVVAAYVLSHFTNHILGLFSFEALEAYRRTVSPFWRSCVEQRCLAPTS